MLLLSRRWHGGVKKLRDKQLICWDSWQLILTVRHRCLLPAAAY